VALELHVTARSVTTTPSRSFTVTVSGDVVPTITFAVGGETLTVPTGTGVTVTVAVPLFPSAVAVIVAVPVVPDVTTPVEETVATLALLELHVI